MKISIMAFFSWGIFYIFSNNQKRIFLTNNLIATGIIFFIFVIIALLQTWFNSKIFIYKIRIEQDQVFIYWQEWKKFKQIVVPINKIKITLIPAGKDTPYLKFEITTDNNKSLILKQSFFPKWNKKVMEDVILQFKDFKNEFNLS